MNTTSKSEQRYFWPLVLGLSAFVLGFLFWLIYFKPSPDSSISVSLLPILNAFFNATSAVFAISGFRAIKQGKKERHQRLMLIALTFSALFLLSYITYHSLHGDTIFQGQGWIRPIYFTMLISHILFSVLMLPLLLATLLKAKLKEFSGHKRIARWTFPIWIYVSITGVLIVICLQVFNS